MSNEIKNEKWRGLFQKQKSKTASNPEVPALIDSYYFIYDCDVNKFSFINSAFKTVTGYDPETFDIDKLINLFIRNNKLYFFVCKEKILHLTNIFFFKNIFKFFFIYRFLFF